MRNKLYENASAGFLNANRGIVREKKTPKSGSTIALLGGRLLGRAFVRGAKNVRPQGLSFYRLSLEREARVLAEKRRKFREEDPSGPFPFELKDTSGILKPGRISKLVDDYIRISTGGFPGLSLDAWKRALEAVNEWRKAGFSHVPIEPILKKNGRYRVSKNKDCTYRVSTKVLNGLTINEIKGQRARFSEKTISEINLQVEKIVRVLRELKIRHGHLHGDNFVVVFHFGRKPRVYLVDFDKARIAGVFGMLDSSEVVRNLQI